MTAVRPTGRLLSLLATAALAACGNLPQPFRHDEGRIPDLARLSSLDVRAVAVRPPDSSAPSQAMADALVKAFALQEIPASVGTGIPGAMSLHGTIERGDGGVRLVWILDGPDHAQQAAARQWLPEAVWQGASPQALAPLATQVVAALTSDHPTAAMAATPSAAHRPTARLDMPPSGLPGDGDSALARAMRNALERHGILVVASGGDYIVEAKVTVAAGPPGQDILAVSWTVRRPDGGSLGAVDQKGAVPAGRLRLPWAELARDVAQGGADGVVQVIGGGRAGPPP